MTILVANDDGIDSPGIRVLAKALKVLGDVWVVAPDRAQNALFCFPRTWVCLGMRPKSREPPMEKAE